VRNTRIAVKGKVLLDNNYWLIPWVSGSIGVGFNHAHGFTKTPVIFEALPNANFTDNTKTTLSYTLGAGVQKAISAHYQIGLGYEFADWGKTSLNRAQGQTLNTGLKTGNIYSHAIMANITYKS